MGRVFFWVSFLWAIAFCMPLGLCAEDEIPFQGETQQAFERLNISSRFHGDVSFLGDNQTSWVSRWRLLSSAKKNIYVTTWMLSDDVFSKALLGVLLQKAQSGVSVRLMVDARGSASITKAFRGRDYLQELANTGNCEIRIYNPISKIVKKAIFKYRSFLSLWASNHDKIIAVDGRAAITGGRNIADYYFLSPADRFDVYRDADILIEEPSAVERMVQAFESEFFCENARVLKKDRWNLVSRKRELVTAATMMNNWLLADSINDVEATALLSSETLRCSFVGQQIALLDDKKARRAAYSRNFAEELALAPRLRGALNRLDERSLRSRDVDFVVLDSGSMVNDGARNSINENLLSLVESAQSEILIANPYLVLTRTALKALKRAGERGVNITILTNSPMSGSSIITQAHFLQNWPQVLAQVPGLRLLVMGPEHVKMHGKMAVFDNAVAAVGSYNVDLVSAQVNGEILSVINSAEFARYCTGYIQGHMAFGEPYVYEYLIERDRNGNPLLDERGEPLIAFGPKDHCDEKTLKKVDKVRKILNFLSKRIGELKPLM